jgi:hypothetical protein
MAVPDKESLPCSRLGFVSSNPPLLHYPNVCSRNGLIGRRVAPERKSHPTNARVLTG